MLERGTGNGSRGGREPDEDRITEMNVAVQRKEDGAGERDEPDRSERGRHRRPLREVNGQDQQWDDDDPAADSEERAQEASDEPDENEPHDHILGRVSIDPIAALAEAPDRAAILLDVDGTLAPIAPRPQDARVPDEARAEITRLAGRYALVACVSGRTGEDARRLVGIEEIRYVGSHGLELEPEAADWSDRIRAFAAGVDWPVEDKGLTISFHYRQAGDEDAALSYLEEVAERAREEGLVPRFGRKVLEIRPPVHADKGTAVRHLLEEAGLRRALYAGDDTTDLDGFRALNGLELGVRVAVSSDEAPEQLVASADLVVSSPAELVELLRRL